MSMILIAGDFSALVCPPVCRQTIRERTLPLISCCQPLRMMEQVYEGIATEKKDTFGSWVKQFENLRQPDPETIKRSDLRNYIDGALDFISVKDNDAIFHISMGYFERLLRKLAAVFPDSAIAGFRITAYREGCGVFAGRVSFENDATATTVAFHWEGRGPIENTWDQFEQWDVQTDGK